ncbi:UDP-3-O-(3-hydroxymyristoyl)glucosamine N-acyltransferase [Croceivirga thetidis]|uniref:UDP-3-O-(3-hydroxymyristoyl)glucosamine N-acyltransferase n=1 Tax=Croceivirga thetidis TaxID=2721623 RepID=A0ABX1GT92_9FLAO|nr:UDP-3-O-(3-hydroxymyristoyl)glucosamine N-acyltransferase [Croceivirga thetidis]NKI32230.1 UDP-3-O-(3-hydroxymyristoyl)glucosamine N-acyltransferase [Croceivirga thetidis]
MKFPRQFTLKEIADLLQVNYVGKPDFSIFGINEIHVVEPGDIVFVDHPKYYDKALNSAATTILINKEVDCPEGKSLLISDDPFADFNKLTKHFQPFKSAGSTISESATIGSRSIIQPNVFIGNDVQIGKNCLIHPNVSIYDNCIIGDGVTIHAGTVLGGDAFYYKRRDDFYDKLLSGGRVIIEDNVDIGAGCTIDRGVTGDTTIKKGTKLDNQIQIGHDTVIGERCLIASQCGIAGCVVIEDDVTLWGQVGVISGITIGTKVVVLAQSGVGRSLEPGKTYFGSPAEEAREKMKEIAYQKQIPSILKKIKNI